jgi:hypothetical protein
MNLPRVLNGVKWGELEGGLYVSQKRTSYLQGKPTPDTLALSTTTPVLRAGQPPARHIDDMAKHPRGMSRRCEAPKLAPRQGGIRFAQINQKGIQIWDIE